MLPVSRHVTGGLPTNRDNEFDVLEHAALTSCILCLDQTMICREENDKRRIKVCEEYRD